MKQYTSNKQVEVVKNINLGNLLESSTASTIEGDKLHSFLVENFNNQKFSSLSSLLQVANHCNASKDTSMIKIGTSIVEKVNANLDSRLVYLIEALENAPWQSVNSLSKQLLEKAEEILAMESMEEKVNTIRSGALGVYKSVTPIVDWLHEAVKIKQENQLDENIYHRAYHPIVFIEEGMNGISNIKLGNKVFALHENNVVETVSSSPKFTYLSTIVEALKYDQVNECLVHTDEKLGVFKINESGIFRGEDAPMLLENFEQSSFIKEMTVLNEALSSNVNEAKRNNQIIDALLSVNHNFKSIVRADNILMVEALRNREKYALIVNENHTAHLATLSSMRYPNVLQSFGRIDEAIEELKYRTGYDASDFFIKSISEQNVYDEKDKLIAEQYNKIISELEQKETYVRSKINESRMNGQINKQKAFENSLIQIQSLIIEQRQNFSKQLKRP